MPSGSDANTGPKPNEPGKEGQNLASGEKGSAAPSASQPTSPAPSDVQSPLDANIDRVEDEPEEKLEPRKLRNALGEAYLGAKEKCGNTYVSVHRDAIVDALTILRDDPELRFDYFAECCGVDYSRWTHERETEGRFEVVYNLVSVPRGERLFLKVGVDDGQAIPTAKHVFWGAEFPEKEIADLFGIAFTGNEFLPGTRFMLPDDWVGHPLRKEISLGGEDVLFDSGTRGPAVEDRMMPHAGESFEGRTGSQDVSGR